MTLLTVDPSIPMFLQEGILAVIPPPPIFGKLTLLPVRCADCEVRNIHPEDSARPLRSFSPRREKNDSLWFGSRAAAHMEALVMKRNSLRWLLGAAVLSVLGTGSVMGQTARNAVLPPAPDPDRMMSVASYWADPPEESDAKTESAISGVYDDYYTECDDSCCSGCNDCCCQQCRCHSCCGCSGGLLIDAEALFFKYRRAGGVRVGADNPGENVFGDYKASPRITLGYISGGGLGFRARYFDWDHAQQSRNGPDEVLAVDTFSVDMELFDEIRLNDKWAVEVSGGVRYNEFNEAMIDQGETRINDFDGWGGIVGLELTRKLGRCGALYARARGAVLVDDKYLFNTGFDSGLGAARETDVIVDSTQGMMEIAVGYEWSRALCNDSLFKARIGYEWQNWYNYSSAFPGPLSADGNEEVFVGPADVGFNGFSVMVGLDY
jgi:hypothetical protein